MNIDYARTELKVADERKYEVLSGARSTASGNGVANGYYDLATPFFATEYTFDHLGLEPQLQGNVTLAKLEADVAGFIAKAAP